MRLDPWLMSLFQRPVTVCSLSSGSAGNSTYIGDGHAGVLVDCGISTKKLLQSMKECGLEGAPVDAVLVTHEHTDHIGAAAVLERHFQKQGREVPFYMTRGTWEGANEGCRPRRIEEVEAGAAFMVRHLRVQPTEIPHDTAGPVCYRVQAGDVSVGVVTDLGKPTRSVAAQMRLCDVLVLEFNHDEEMLMAGGYPYSLKQRILGDWGHLSNRQAQALLREGAGDRLRHVMLAHLSEENNTPTKAMLAAAGTLRELHISDRVHLHMTRQKQALPPVVIDSAHI